MESFEEQMDRLEMMANGDKKWDLSDHDRAAIAAAVARVADLIEENGRLLARLHKMEA